MCLLRSSRSRRGASCSFVAARLTGALAVAAILLLAGCQPGERLYRVYGKVTFDQQPLTEGVVILSNPAKGLTMTANINDQGEYEVTMAKGKGLPEGEYEIYISPAVQNAPVLGPPGKPPPVVDVSKMPEKYRNPKTSGWRLKVAAGENRFDCPMVSTASSAAKE